MDTDEFMDHVRNRASKKLERVVTKSNRLDDLDLAVKTTRALLSSNKEIWQRCVESGCGPQDDKLIFERAAFTKIQVKTTSINATQKTLSFQAVPELTTNDFGAPKPVPEQLTEIVAPTLAPDGIFPNYDRYLETALLLNKETLLPFLSVLKKHLEDIQILLGEIDSWLMTGSFCIDYMNENFNSSRNDFELPESTIGCDAYRCGKSHIGLVCVRCKRTFHDEYSASHEPTCTTNSSHNGYHSFLHLTSVTLKECATDGNHDHTFDITQEAQQEKLKAFLVFVS